MIEPDKTLDPRSPWDYVRRMELVRYAAEKGVTEIVEAMPKTVMVQILRQKGFGPPNVRTRSIGKNMNPRAWDTDVNTHQVPPQPKQDAKAETVEVDADELMAREWLKPNFDNMTFNDLRAELKKRGIKWEKRWKAADIRAVLNGNAAAYRAGQ